VVGDALGPISFRILNASIHGNGLTRNSVNLRSNHFGQNSQSSRNCPSLSLKDKLSLDKVLDSFGKMVTTIPNGYTAVGGAVLQQVPKFLNSDIISKLYTEQEQHRQLFHENLAAMAKNCKKLIVFIDELDRCKPSFAVQTLETIKHYFDVDNVVFIFGIDGIQIRETIRKFYGAGFDSSSYLTRFFESQILLPKPTIDQMIQFCIKEIYVPTNEREWLRKLLNYAAITPREVTSVLSDAKLILDYCDLKDDHVAATSLFLLIVLLLSMKCKKMETYELIIAGKLEAPKSQLWSERFNVEDVMYCISEMCTASVNTIRSSGHKPIGTEDALSENNIYAAMKYLLSHADESAIVGNEVTQIMNMIAIPIMKNDEKEGVI